MNNPKPIRISLHARQNLHDREIAIEEVERTCTQPEFVIVGSGGREVHMRRYQDVVLNQ